MYRAFHTSNVLIFLAEADRLEAGGFNLVIDIKKVTTQANYRPDAGFSRSKAEA